MTRPGFLPRTKAGTCYYQNSTQAGPLLSLFNCAHYAQHWALSSASYLHLDSRHFHLLYESYLWKLLFFFFLMYIHYKSSAFTLFKIWEKSREKKAEWRRGYCEVLYTQRGQSQTESQVFIQRRKAAVTDKWTGRCRGRSDFSAFSLQRVARCSA